MSFKEIINDSNIYHLHYFNKQYNGDIILKEENNQWIVNYIILENTSFGTTVKIVEKKEVFDSKTVAIRYLSALKRKIKNKYR